MLIKLDNVKTWKYLLLYCTLERRIFWSLVDSHHKGPVKISLSVFFVVSLNKKLNNDLSCWWFEMPWHSCGITAMKPITAVTQSFNCNVYRQVSNIRQLNCWSPRCSWSIACRRCSNYIFILNLTPGCNGLGKDNYKMRQEAFKFWDLVHLILETLR